MKKIKQENIFENYKFIRLIKIQHINFTFCINYKKEKCKRREVKEYIEERTIEIANYIIENEKIPKEFDNYVILQISDLHNKSFGKNNCKLISKIDQINPQVVFITGDIIDGENKNYQVEISLPKEANLPLEKNLVSKYQDYLESIYLEYQELKTDYEILEANYENVYEKKELALFGWVTEIKVFDAKKNSFVASIKSRAFNLIIGLCMIRNIQMINGNIFSILAKKKDFDSIIDYIYNKEILKNNDYKVEIDSDFIIFFDNHKLYYISD